MKSFFLSPLGREYPKGERGIIQFKNGNQIWNRYDAGGRKLSSMNITVFNNTTTPIAAENTIRDYYLNDEALKEGTFILSITSGAYPDSVILPNFGQNKPQVSKIFFCSDFFKPKRPGYVLLQTTIIYSLLGTSKLNNINLSA